MKNRVAMITGGVKGIGRAIGLSLAQEGWSVAVCYRKSGKEAELKAMVKNIPAGTIGELKDAVSLARFRLSDEARYINGANIHLSGGWGI